MKCVTVLLTIVAIVQTTEITPPAVEDILAAINAYGRSLTRGAITPFTHVALEAPEMLDVDLTHLEDQIDELNQKYIDVLQPILNVAPEIESAMNAYFKSLQSLVAAATSGGDIRNALINATSSNYQLDMTVHAAIWPIAHSDAVNGSQLVTGLGVLLSGITGHIAQIVANIDENVAGLTSEVKHFLSLAMDMLISTAYAGSSVIVRIGSDLLRTRNPLHRINSRLAGDGFRFNVITSNLKSLLR